MKTLLALCIIAAGFAGLGAVSADAETTVTTTKTMHHRPHYRHHYHHHYHHVNHDR